MKRNVIPNLRKVDWSDARRQSEWVNSVVSALGALGETLDYDTVCAVSGSAFRTSFSMTPNQWNHGNYGVLNTPILIEHTFRMLGYRVTQHGRGDYDVDKKWIVDSINNGVPVITLQGVINCSDACVISGYDDGGDVLLGWNPFMHMRNDHPEPHDETGYFRKSGWHDGFFAGVGGAGSQGRILIIDGKGETLSKAAIFAETLKRIKRLIVEETLVSGQYNGLAAHRAFANALQTYEWTDHFEPYLNVMCNYKQYLDRQYAAAFFRDNNRSDLAVPYENITALCRELGELIPQDFSASDLFRDKAKLKPYCDTLLQIAELENQAKDWM